jgi:pyruvate-formate lyase-activating enzyme
MAAHLPGDAIPVGYPLPAGQFHAFQVAAGRHVGFSLTRACPLNCAHCIVATTAPSGLPTVTISPADAARYAAELPDLAESGVNWVSFTGGEPLLAPDALLLLSCAAKKAGMSCTVVTAGHWARSPQAAARTVSRFAAVDNWHVSTDVFHTEFLPVRHVIDAVHAVVGAGRVAVLRMAVATPPSDQDVELYRTVSSAVPDGVPIAVQPVTRAGRAAILDVGDPPAPRRPVPCVTTGMVVRDDASVSPCCGPLTDQRDGHPFRWPRASEAGLAAAYRAWQTDPLLQLIRTVGFGPVLQWVREDDPGHPVLGAGPRHPCDTCVGLWRRPGTEELVRRRLARPATREKVRAVYTAVFAPAAAEAEPRATAETATAGTRGPR